MDSQLDQNIRSTLNDFRLVSQSWYQGPQFNVVNNQLPAEIQINLGFNSLRRQFFGFWRKVDDSTAKRENYRLSHCVTAYYFLIGTTQWPNVPVQGNAGNNMGQINNSDFMYQSLKCFGKHLGYHSPSFNSHNAAVNFSEFNPAANNPDDNGPNQMCYFKENRRSEGAIFGTEFVSIMNQKGVFSGYDTSSAKPWSLFLLYDSTNPYQGASLFQMFLNYDCVFMNNNGMWTVIGRN